MRRIALLVVFSIFFGPASALANGDKLISAGAEGKHLDIYDTGNNRQCFDNINYNKGYADFLNNPPFEANHNKGDWGNAGSGRGGG